MKSQIHLIRHGITVGNKNRLFYGASDIELAPEGIEALKAQAAEGMYPYEENSDFYFTLLYVRNLKQMSLCAYTGEDFTISHSGFLSKFTR